MGEFKDERGEIRDLVGAVDSITEIHTIRGTVRGNHVHRETTQFTYIVRGILLISNGRTEQIVGPGKMVVHLPGEPHAWEAKDDCVCLVFTRGPRSGENYEADTYRLEEPLL